MPELAIGAEQFTDEDRLHSGSRFTDVVDALFTQEDIGGARSESINAADLRNAPDVTVFRRGPARRCSSGLRQSSGASTSSPVIDGTQVDFRDEVTTQLFDPGDPVPKRTLTFTIEVTDDGEGPSCTSRIRPGGTTATIPPRHAPEWREGAVTREPAGAVRRSDTRAQQQGPPSRSGAPAKVCRQATRYAL